tara:strand:- start:43 stop:1128 length:1086 start_codon:yes stop_codon:yes gene_type:complete
MKYLMLLPAFLLFNQLVSAQSLAECAEKSQQTLENSFKSADGTYYLEKRNSDNPFFHYWWNAHALDVLVDGWERSKDEVYLERIEVLVNNWVKNNDGSLFKEYYDDMEWYALALLRAGESTENQAYTGLAYQLWEDIKTGYNSNQGGGIAWRKNQLDYKNTPANAPAIIFACRKYQLTKDTDDLVLAISLYEWLKAHLVEASGKVNDGVNRQGKGAVDYWQFTYNYGIYIGAAYELYRATGEERFLNDAFKTANYCIEAPDIVVNDILKDEGGGDGGLFKGILIRYLTHLALDESLSKNYRKSYVQFLEDQTHLLMSNGYDERGIIGSNWLVKPDDEFWTSSQLSGMMLIEAAVKCGFNIR